MKLATRILIALVVVFAMVAGPSPLSAEQAQAHSVSNHCHINSSLHSFGYSGGGLYWSHKSFYAEQQRKHDHYMVVGSLGWRYQHSTWTDCGGPY